MLRRKIGQFYIIRHLGSRGLADVYLGVNPKSGERRAIKFLPRNHDEMQKAQPRLLREIDRARNLSHPRIVRVVDSGTLEGRSYYATPYYPGGDLSRRLGRSVPVAEAIRIFAEICDGLAYAHARGVAHGNLKPSKVLLDGSGSPAIAGLGISSVRNVTRYEHHARWTNTIRSQAYASPEQRRGRPDLDRRADVYSLGALLYTMIMGFPPLGQYPMPGAVKPGIPAALQDLLGRCLAVDPPDRPVDAVALQQALSDMRDKPCDKPEAEKFDTGKSDGLNSASDRIQMWFELLRSGTTRDRLFAVREMVEEIEPGEANAILKLYPHEEDRVRWGLIRVFGELRIRAASPMIVSELQHPFHRECAVEALGKIGSRDAFAPLVQLLRQHPESALEALLPLASTGGPLALQHLRPYLLHAVTAVRQAAIRAVVAIGTAEAHEVLRAHLLREMDDGLRFELAQFIQMRVREGRDAAADLVPSTM